MKIGALRLFTRNHSNFKPIKGSWSLAAWHWPSSITWRWSIHYRLKSGPVRMGFYKSNRYAGLNTKYFGAVKIQWQDNMWKDNKNDT